MISPLAVPYTSLSHKLICVMVKSSNCAYKENKEKLCKKTSNTDWITFLGLSESQISNAKSLFTEVANTRN